MNTDTRLRQAKAARAIAHYGASIEDRNDMTEEAKKRAIAAYKDYIMHRFRVFYLPKYVDKEVD